MSTWGKRVVPGFYDNDRGSESNYTMSSGLSPRETKPREREFDLDAAKRVRALRGCVRGCACARARGVPVCLTDCPEEQPQPG